METNRIDERRFMSLPVASTLLDRDPAGVAPIGSDPRGISAASPVLAVSLCSTASAAPELIYAAAQFRTQGFSVFAGKVSPSHVSSQGLGAGIVPTPKSVDASQIGVSQQQGTGVAEAMANLMAKRRGVPPRGKPEYPA
ncbi:hypothetical protein Athai_44720 [Actinocatenispora thailandica]|uniref:Uncharacterized protein n=1 Tax=Actinocatenispora thailandica TaxID=227318 RepID=A0A7R7DSH5_9ACTN|nr:hypothetical protein [Actinocatenispora thailandica]BCJ36969.1 hypothetical protein Athai_44720 [Actinocatenispora thailandica]